MTPEREARLREHLGWVGVRKVSPEGLRCADLIDEWVGGLHNFPGGGRALGKIDWTQHFVEVRCHGGLSSPATFDGTKLTSLVFLAHDLAIRAEVSACNMQMFKVRLFPRAREGRGFSRHPSLEEAVAAWRAHSPAPVEGSTP